MARRRSATPPTALLRTGPTADSLPRALPMGKEGEMVKVHTWGENNLLPQEVLRVLYDSGTASTCVERIGQFVNGRGFTQEATAKTRANERQTLAEVLAEASETAAVGLGVAYILRFTYGGQLAELYVADVDCLRREKDGTGRFVLNSKLAEGAMPVKDNEVYLPYDPSASPAELGQQVLEAAGSAAGYWGHLWFSFPARLGRKRYPLPTWWASKEAVEADAEVPRYDLKQFRNGFFPDTIMTVVGRKYEDVPNENWQPGLGQTEADRPFVRSAERAALDATVRELKDNSSKASIMLNVVETKEEMPQIDWVDKGPNSKGLTDASARIEGRVYRLFGVPPELCGVATPGKLGSNQQIVTLIQLFGLVVDKARELVLTPLRHLFPALDLSITPLDPVDYLDPAVAGVMTPDELRAVRGLPPVEKPETSAAQQTLAALNGLSPLLANAVLSALTEDEKRALIGLAPKVAPTPTAPPPIPAVPRPRTPKPVPAP